MFKQFDRVLVKNQNVQGNIIEILNDDITRLEYYLVEIADEYKANIDGDYLIYCEWDDIEKIGTQKYRFEKLMRVHELEEIKHFTDAQVQFLKKYRFKYLVREAQREDDTLDWDTAIRIFDNSYTNVGELNIQYISGMHYSFMENKTYRIPGFEPYYRVTCTLEGYPQ